MEILFPTKKLAKQLNSDSLMTRQHGVQRARLIRRRLDQLRAAERLDDMRNLPGRCHELTGNLRGVLSIDLDGPNRLLFEPSEEPAPTKEDGGLDWSRVKAVLILRIEDTHE